MRNLIFILSFFCFSVNLFGQSSSEVKAKINEIKRSSSYLSAEATLPTMDEAMAVAKELLVSEINDWLSTKRNGGAVKQVVLQDINSYTQLMDMKRGTKTRAFVFVKKKDIVLIYGEGQIVLNDNEKGGEIKSLKSLASKDKSSEAEVESHPQSVSEGRSATPAEVGTSEPKDESLKPADYLKSIVDAKSMQNLKPVFASLKASGNIEYGVYNPNVNKETCYLLFYTRTGAIKAVVKKNGNIYKDVVTDNALSLNDFNGCGAYWFILK